MILLIILFLDFLFIHVICIGFLVSALKLNKMKKNLLGGMENVNLSSSDFD